MKKKITVIIAVLLFVALIFAIATGFTVNSSAYITDEFEVSKDGREITFTVGVGSSAGFVRGYKDKQDNGSHCLKFYSAWGGFNSSVGAKNRYTLHLADQDSEICVYHGEKGYEPALKKDPVSGEWARVK